MKLEALRALYEAVKADRSNLERNALAVFGDMEAAMGVVPATYGSVDAALALKDALLPDAEVDRITQSKALKRWTVILGIGSHISRGDADRLARALLLAILAALIAIEERKR